ncbi:MAG TPA: radical SAM protein, partial [bacterium]|nr:radical SAM protein [bacterium]
FPPGAVLRSVPQNIPLLVGTNAIEDERIARCLDRIRATRPISVQVSVDGTAETHDRVRGVAGNHDAAVRLLKWCQREGIPSTVSFTLGADNYADLLAVQSLAGQLDAHFAFRPVNRGEFYGNQDGHFAPSDFAEAQIQTVEQDVTALIKQKMREGYYNQTDFVYWGLIPDYLRGTVKYPRCLAAKDFFLIDPAGVLYPCPQYWQPMGNVHDWPEAFMSPRRLEVAAKVERLECGGCWNDCFVWNSLCRQPQWVRTQFARILHERIGVPQQAPSEILPGEDSAVACLGQGWFPSDSPGARWTSLEAALFISGGSMLHVTLSNPCPQRQSAPTQLEVEVDGNPSATVPLDFQGERTLDIEMPRKSENTIREVLLKCDRTWTPASLGLSKDSRKLGVAVIRVWTTQ